MNTTKPPSHADPEHDSLFVTDGKPPAPAWSPNRGRYGGDLRVGFSQKLQREVNLCYQLEYFHWFAGMRSSGAHVLRTPLADQGQTR